MRRISPLAFGCLLVLFSCKKNETRVADETQNQLQTNAAAATHRGCAAHDVLLRQVAADPERGRRLDVLERFIQEKMMSAKGKPPGSGGGTPERGPVTIPVIVHVVLPQNAVVTDQQINGQLAVLNADFQKANAELKNSSVYLAGYAYNSVADCDITFELKSVVRKNTTVASFGTNEAVKFTSQGGSDAVDATTALNLWVCDLSGGLLGYAQFPGGSVATDGVVIDYQAFGTSASYKLYPEFNKGRTATHEVGHWLNLRHIWGDSRCGNDYIEDTPLQDGPNYGNPTTNESSFCKGQSSPDMWMNYMDYSDDQSLYMFTSLQKSRIDLALANARSSYYKTTTATGK